MIKLRTKSRFLRELKFIHEIKSLVSSETYSSDPFLDFAKFVSFYNFIPPTKTDKNSFEIPVKRLYDVYDLWCEANLIPDFHRLSPNHLGKLLGRMKFRQTYYLITGASRRQRVERSHYYKVNKFCRLRFLMTHRPKYNTRTRDILINKLDETSELLAH